MMSIDSKTDWNLCWLSIFSGFNHAVVAMGMVILSPVVLKGHFFAVLSSFAMADKMKVLGVLLAIKPACESLAAWVSSRFSFFPARGSIFCCLGLIVSALMVFVIAIVFGQLSLLFLAQALFGVGGAVIYLIETVIAHTVEPQRQTRAFNYLEWSIGLGMLLGPVVGSSLAHVGGWHPQIAYILFAVIGAVIFLLGGKKLVLPKVMMLAEPEATQSVRKLDYVAWFLFMLGWHFYFHWFPALLIFHLHYTSAHLGFVFTVMGVYYVFCQFVIVRHFSYLQCFRRVLLVAIPVVACCVALMPLTQSKWELYAVLLLYMLAISFVLPFWKALFSRHAVTRQARVFGTITVITTCSSILATALGGMLSAYSLQATFLMSAFLLMSSALCVFLRRSVRLISPSFTVAE